MCLKMALSYVSTESRELPRGRAFHNLGAATWNDLSPSVALVLNVGYASKIPPDDLRLYAPCDFKPLCNIKFPFQVCETAHSTHFKNIILAVNQRQPSYTKIGNMATIEVIALIMNFPALASDTPSRHERSRIVSFFPITAPHEANPPQVSQVYGDN